MKLNSNVLRAGVLALCCTLACSDNTSAPEESTDQVNVWARAGGGLYTDRGNALATNTAGSPTVTGEFLVSAEFDTVSVTSAGNIDAFTASYGTNGRVAWANRAGSAATGGNELGYDVAVDVMDNTLVGGIFRGVATFPPLTITARRSQDGFVAKYGSDGLAVWVEQVSGSSGNATVRAVATDSEGNVIVGGSFGGDVEFGTQTLPGVRNWDGFVAKYDGNGGLQWAHVIAGILDDHTGSVAADGAGNVFAMGSFADTVLVGTDVLRSEGYTDVFLVKYDKDGNILWANRAGGAGQELTLGYRRGGDLAVDANEDVLLTGHFYESADFGGTTVTSAGTHDVFVAKYDAMGSVAWARSFGGAGVDVGLGIAGSSSGPVTTGYFEGQSKFGSNTLTSAGDDDIFVALLDTDGGLLWVSRAGGTGGDAGQEVASDGGVNIYVTGFFSGTARFGSRSVTSAGEEDVFLWRINAGAIE